MHIGHARGLRLAIVHGQTLKVNHVPSTVKGPVARALRSVSCLAAPCVAAPCHATPAVSCRFAPSLAKRCLACRALSRQTLSDHANPSSFLPNEAPPASSNPVLKRRAKPWQACVGYTAGFIASLPSTSSSALHTPDNSCNCRYFFSAERSSLTASANSCARSSSSLSTSAIAR